MLVIFGADAQGEFATVINVPPARSPVSIGSDTQLNLFDGGSLPDNFAAGAADGSSSQVELNVIGGSVGVQFNARGGSRVNVIGGVIGDGFSAENTDVTIAGGSVGVGFRATDSRITMSAGSIDSNADAFRSTITISGGTVAERFRVGRSVVTLSGGSIGRDFRSMKGTPVIVTGGSIGDGFRAINSGPVTISGGSIGNRFNAQNARTVTVAGGSIGDGFNASDVAVNISGGVIGNGFHVNRGAVTMSGGSIGDRFSPGRLTPFTLSGGTLGDGISLGGRPGNVTVIGREFRLDGLLIDGLENDGDRVSLDIPTGAVLSGTLHDGTPLAWSSAEGDQFTPGSLTLQAATLPRILRPLILASTDPVPLGIREGQTLRVDSGGVVPDHFNAGRGSITEIEAGGRVGRNFEAVAADVRIAGGTIGDGFDAFRDSRVTIEGGDFRLDGAPLAGFENQTGAFSLDVPVGAMLAGTLADGTPFAFSSIDGDSFVRGAVSLVAATLPPVGPPLIVASADVIPQGIRRGQTLRVDEGGAVGDDFNAGHGSAVDVASDGSVGRNFEAVGAEVTVSGGAIGDDFDAGGGSSVHISSGSIGNGFDADLQTNVLVSGGTVGGSLHLHRGSTVTIAGGVVGGDLNARGGSVVTISGGEVGDGLGADGSAVAISGGTVGTHFYAGNGSTMTITGGSIGPFSDLIRGSTMMLNGGSIGDDFNVRDGSTLTITEGSIGDNLRVDSSSVTIGGGRVGDDVRAGHDTVITISGGRVGDRFIAFDDSNVILSGGTIGEGFGAAAGSTIHLLGREFLIDGLPLEALVSPGDSLVLETRGERRLTGTLRDGSPFGFDLNPTRDGDNDYFDPAATLRLTLVVPEPGTLLPTIFAAVIVLLSRRRRPGGCRNGPTTGGIALPGGQNGDTLLIAYRWAIRQRGATSVLFGPLKRGQAPSGNAHWQGETGLGARSQSPFQLRLSGDGRMPRTGRVLWEAIATMCSTVATAGKRCFTKTMIMRPF